MAEDADQITTLLSEWRKGSSQARERLVASVYDELRRLAEHYLATERSGHTLQATALVNELYLRLAGGQDLHFENRGHFFAVAAQQMRRLLVDYARSRQAEKRGGDRMKVSLEQAGELGFAEDHDIIAIHEALEELDKLDSRAAKVVELRFFGGLTESEAAAALAISVATLKRDWEFARAWLVSQLEGSG
jgi:RNA polymerase sigma factor (TIGR02999 family)